MTDLNWLPNFFIAGAPKAGTSSLHGYIADHPDAFGSREKETYFFSDPGTHMFRPAANAALGFETWRDQFPIPADARPKVIVESTPSYLYSARALAQIPALPSAPKCLFVLREPATQIYSLYTYFRDNWSWIPAEMSFEAFLAAARAGSHAFGGNELAQNAFANARYIDFLRPWHEALGEGRIMVASFDELCADERAFTKRVAAWLGLDPAFYDSYAFPRENETYAPKNRALHRLNVAVRGAIPRGALYRGLRRLYRAANTTKPGAKTDGDKALIGALAPEFTEANAALDAAYNIRFTPPTQESSHGPR